MRNIIYLTDTHLDEPTPGQHGADAQKNWNEMLAELALHKPDQIIFGGDIGAFSAYPYFFESLSRFDKLRVTPGNHDTTDQVRQFLPLQKSAGPTGLYFSEEAENLKWIFLDSSTDELPAEQLEWLEKELQGCSLEIILFIHHPILEVDTAVDRKYPLKNREQIKKVLLQYGKQVTVFCGHYHTEDQIAFENITQYVTPAISYQIKKGTTEVEGDATYFGYRLIYIGDQKIETKVIVLYPDDF